MQKTGILRDLFIEVLPNKKIHYKGKLETTDQNGQQKFLKVNIEEYPENFVFISGDKVSFEVNTNGKFAGLYAEKITWLGENDFTITQDLEDLATEIMKINDFMAVIQMGNPYVKDSTGYSNDKFHLGFKLSKYWLDHNYTNQKPLILQLAASLLRGHTKQLLRHSNGTITFSEIEYLIPKASILKTNKLLKFFRKRKDKIKPQKSVHVIPTFYINLIKLNTKIVSFTIYSDNESLMTKIIDDFKFSYDTLDSNENKFEQDIDDEDPTTNLKINNLVPIEVTLDKCYRGMEKIKDGSISTIYHYLNIPYSIFEGNHLFIDFIKNNKANFKWSEDYELVFPNE